VVDGTLTPPMRRKRRENLKAPLRGALLRKRKEGKR
jgi:hypothetical protein